MGAMRKMRLPRSLNEPTWRITESASITKMPPTKKPRKLSEAEFQQVFKEVRDDINELQLHDGILSGVVENLTRYPRLSNNFPAFFTAFYSAMRTDLIIRLGRIYDPEGTGDESCTLARCLGLIREHQQFFTDEAIKARLSEGYRTANRDYLAFHRPDLKQIDTDLDRIVQSRVDHAKQSFCVAGKRDIRRDGLPVRPCHALVAQGRCLTRSDATVIPI